jgi:hypothetical protein
MKTKPIHELRLGAVRAAVWRNDTETGVRYNITFSRLFKNGDEWKSSDSFGRDDLLVLGKLADQVHTWVCGRQQEVQRPAEAKPTPTETKAQAAVAKP